MYIGRYILEKTMRELVNKTEEMTDPGKDSDVVKEALAGLSGDPVSFFMEREDAEELVTLGCRMYNRFMIDKFLVVSNFI